MANIQPPPTGSVKQDPYWKRYLQVDEKYSFRHRIKEVPKQLVVYRSNPDTAAFDNWIRKLESRIERLKKPRDSFRIISICGTCNETLLLIVGEGVETLVTTEAATKGNSASPAVGSTGEENGIYYSANFEINIPGNRPKSPKRPKSEKGKYSATANTRKEVKVAILDTGLLPGEVDEFIVEPNTNPCIVNATIGWDFTEPGPDYKDDHKEFHGSTVTRFTIDEFAAAEDATPIRIIPVKVQDQNGISDLYHVMCAMAYAKSMGANIVNASFGYYAPLDYAKNDIYCVKIFRAFIKEVLTDNGILLIAAAGNAAKQDSINKLFNPNATKVTKDKHPVPKDPRNLDGLHFFPASFATEPDLWNVISVTTVTPDLSGVSPTQNFSKNVVDIGVPADEPIHNGFSNPRVPGSFIAGSSFATPIITGMIAAHYHLIDGIKNKEEIIRILIGNRLLEAVPPDVAVGRGILFKKTNESVTAS
jgi:subtilase family protein